MADSVARRNKRAQEKARKDGRPAFALIVVEDWPGCVQCGATIRYRGLDGDRTCECPGVWWQPPIMGDGWMRRTRTTEGGEGDG